jgi:zinc/manganese transport system substrate-binding protein/manganese/iron transport system substrate-binding protein
MTRHHLRTASVIGLVAAAGLALTGCSQGEQADGGDQSVHIVASTTQVADFTRNVVGDTGAEITQIVQPNQSAHDIELTAADSAAIEGADAVIVNGVDLDHIVSDAAASDKVIDTSTGITLQAGEEEDEAGEASEGEGHDHGAEDPHIWTAPENARQMVQNIADGLARTDPDHADAYQDNAQAYEARLDALDQWITTSFEPVAPDDRKFVSTHDTFGYFVKAYDITQDDSVLGSLDDHAEPSEAELQQLVAKIEATGVKAVFAEASVDPKVADRIAQESGVRLYSGDDALYGDSLGTEGSDGATYIDATVHNVTLIGQSWGLDLTAPEL